MAAIKWSALRYWVKKRCFATQARKNPRRRKGEVDVKSQAFWLLDWNRRSAPRSRRTYPWPNRRNSGYPLDRKLNKHRRMGIGVARNRSTVIQDVASRLMEENKRSEERYNEKHKGFRDLDDDSCRKLLLHHVSLMRLPPLGVTRFSSRNEENLISIKMHM